MAQILNRGRRTEATTPRVGLRDLGPYLSQHRRALVGVAVCAVFGSLAGLAQPLLIRRVLAAVQDKKPVMAAVVAVVSLLVANAVVDGLRRYLLQRAAEGVVLTARRRLGGHLLRLPISEYDARRTGDLLSRIGADTTLLRAVVTGGLFEISSGVVLVIGAIIAMALIDIELLLVTVVSVAVGLFLVSTVSRRVRDLTELSQARVADMTSAVERALSAVRTIRASGAAEREATQVSLSAEAAYDAGLKAARLEALVAPGASLAVQGSFVLVLGLGGARVADGHLSVANLIAFVLYLFLLVLPLGQGLQAYTTLQTGLGALQRIADGMALPQESAGDNEVRPGVDATAPLVEFVNVGFAYGDGRAVLHGVSFAVPKGARVALVGPSGGGKSTLLALVERFYDATSGEVRFAGTDVRRWPRLALRVNMGYVEQEAPVLAGTIAANLRLAAPDADDAALDAVVDAVALRTLVSRALHGLETEVGDGGVLLSGGERQRLAIGRALLAAPPLLLLDEPTSNLDARNESLLRAAVDAVARDRTLLIVAHRLSTVIDADSIVVIDEGRVAAIGTHQELLSSSPLYRELAASQLLVTPSPSLGSGLIAGMVGLWGAEPISSERAPSRGAAGTIRGPGRLRCEHLDRSCTRWRGSALAVLTTLAVKGRAPMTGYSRSLFGGVWAGDGHGCDTRNDVLQRDLTAAALRKGDCTVADGDLADPYTGRDMHFVRGETTSALVQIDHVAAIGDLWQTGAQQLTTAQRTALYNDPLELLAVNGRQNTIKGDGDAATWLPPNKTFRCRYVALQVAVKLKYNLWVTHAEHDAIARVLSTCPAQPLPDEPGGQAA